MKQSLKEKLKVMALRGGTENERRIAAMKLKDIGEIDFFNIWLKKEQSFNKTNKKEEKEKTHQCTKHNEYWEYLPYCKYRPFRYKPHIGAWIGKGGFTIYDEVFCELKKEYKLFLQESF